MSSSEEDSDLGISDGSSSTRSREEENVVLNDDDDDDSSSSTSGGTSSHGSSSTRSQEEENVDLGNQHDSDASTVHDDTDDDNEGEETTIKPSEQSEDEEGRGKILKNINNIKEILISLCAVHCWICTCVILLSIVIIFMPCKPVYMILTTCSIIYHCETKNNIPSDIKKPKKKSLRRFRMCYWILEYGSIILSYIIWFLVAVVVGIFSSVLIIIVVLFVAAVIVCLIVGIVGNPDPDCSGESCVPWDQYDIMIFISGFLLVFVVPVVVLFVGTVISVPFFGCVVCLIVSLVNSIFTCVFFVLFEGCVPLLFWAFVGTRKRIMLRFLFSKDENESDSDKDEDEGGDSDDEGVDPVDINTVYREERSLEEIDEEEYSVNIIRKNNYIPENQEVIFDPLNDEFSDEKYVETQAPPMVEKVLEEQGINFEQKNCLQTISFPTTDGSHEDETSCTMSEEERSEEISENRDSESVDSSEGSSEEQTCLE